jgi:hypothetical protein
MGGNVAEVPSSPAGRTSRRGTGGQTPMIRNVEIDPKRQSP